MSQEVTDSIVVVPRPRFRFAWRHVALLLILLLAAFLRLWRLDSLPPGLYHDEAYNGLDALSLLSGETFPLFYEGWELYALEAHEDRPVQQTGTPIFFEGNFGREPLHIYLMALSIWIFGPTPLAIRLVPAVAGILAVLMTYLAAKVLLSSALGTEEEQPYQAWLPLLAALTLAVLYPAITFSRFGIRAMVFVPIETAAVYCFWRGIRGVEHKLRDTSEQPFTYFNVQLGTFSPPWFIVAGFFLGLGLYTYAAGRLFPLLFVAFILLWFWRDRRALRQQWGNIAVMALTSMLVALPLMLFFLRYPYFFIFRSRFVANRGANTFPGRPWITWTLNVGRVFLGLFWRGEMHLRHNLPNRPFMDPLQVLFAALGVLFIIRQRLRRHHVFLALWFLVMLLPSLLSGDAPHFGRMIGAAPPAAILVALGADWLAQSIGGRLSRQKGTEGEEQPRRGWRYALAYWLLTPLFLLSILVTFQDYFQQYANHPELAEAFYVSDWELGQYAAALPEDTITYLSPTQEQMATIYFALGGEIERLRSFYSPNSLVPAGHVGEPVVYLIRPMAESTLPRLEMLIPQGIQLQTAQEFSVFQVNPASPRTPPENESDASWGGAISLTGWSTRQEGNQLMVTLYWQADVKMARSYTAFVHLLDGDGNLITQLDRLPEGYPTTDWQPGEMIVDTYTLELPPGLPAGSYFLQSGFYHLPSDERLGGPVVLGGVSLAQP